MTKFGVVVGHSGSFVTQYRLLIIVFLVLVFFLAYISAISSSLSSPVFAFIAFCCVSVSGIVSLTVSLRLLS